ncbi:hypothetical protein V8F06_014376 [Rhypophila decipiens]
MTVASCAAFCGQRDFEFFGVEYAHECYCGNELGGAFAPEDECSSLVWRSCSSKYLRPRFCPIAVLFGACHSFTFFACCFTHRILRSTFISPRIHHCSGPSKQLLQAAPPQFPPLRQPAPPLPCPSRQPQQQQSPQRPRPTAILQQPGTLKAVGLVCPRPAKPSTQHPPLASSWPPFRPVNARIRSVQDQPRAMLLVSPATGSRHLTQIAPTAAYLDPQVLLFTGGQRIGWNTYRRAQRANEWYRQSVTFQAPTSFGRFELQWVIMVGSAPSVMYIDDISIVKVATQN